MWIVSYIFNEKNCVESIESYERALARYGVLKSSGKDPSMHWEADGEIIRGSDKKESTKK
jgi:hypothetical protein